MFTVRALAVVNSLDILLMGAQGSKIDFRQAVIDLTSKKGKQDDETFWEQLWSPDSVQSVGDIFAMIPSEDVRKLRDDYPKNLASLCYKVLEKLQHARDNPIIAIAAHFVLFGWLIVVLQVINCVRLLTRLIPYMFEDAEWRGYFWSSVPTGNGQTPMAIVLLSVLCDLLFCPGFTVGGVKEKVNDLSSLETCELIWEAGVGFVNKPVSSAQLDQNRTEVLKLLLTCLSEVIYAPVSDENRLRWVTHFTSAENRHVLPLFTSLLNVVCAYDPIGIGLPYNYLLFNDSREPLVETALQGITRLLSNPLLSTYLPNSAKKISFHQELLVLLWKCCEYNQKFMFYVLKTSDVLEILVPILFHITESRNDSARVGLVHMSVFLILLLSGERNFGVRLNKPYIAKAAIDIQTFSGTHADLLIIVFHKLITTGNHRLQSLFDCLLTIIVNVSPYLKSLSMVASNKLLHLVEAFSTPWFLFSSPTNHHLVFFLLEVFNNIIQYQFDGNSNLIYTIIRKRQVFYQLANLPTDSVSISKSLSGRKGKAREEIIDQIKSATAPATPEMPSGTTAGLAATPQVTSVPSTTGDVDNKTPSEDWVATEDWVEQWKSKLPLQTIMRLLQVLVPQVEKICIDKSLTDESEILKFLQHGTLVGLLPVPHPILIRKYQANAGTNHWFRTYMWGVIYLRNTEPPIWYDTEVKLFEIQ
ncbi:hypothetical protein DICVIV_01529 [Dictyocaulus viviparus]|uniref:High-temperature-induced dauer-formation protein n=1 Tax=Dictyocaulus viviparus TaxID=29172 RepID=A0A0D8Y811_DICVI|nr:hypothetical protein DICVIV_01529 [Dictyocaulus viviparus]